MGWGIYAELSKYKELLPNVVTDSLAMSYQAYGDEKRESFLKNNANTFSLILTDVSSHAVTSFWLPRQPKTPGWFAKYVLKLKAWETLLQPKGLLISAGRITQEALQELEAIQLLDQRVVSPIAQARRMNLVHREKNDTRWGSARINFASSVYVKCGREKRKPFFEELKKQIYEGGLVGRYDVVPPPPSPRILKLAEVYARANAKYSHLSAADPIRKLWTNQMVEAVTRRAMREAGYTMSVSGIVRAVQEAPSSLETQQTHAKRVGMELDTPPKDPDYEQFDDGRDDKFKAELAQAIADSLVKSTKTGRRKNVPFVG